MFCLLHIINFPSSAGILPEIGDAQLLDEGGRASPMLCHRLSQLHHTRLCIHHVQTTNEMCKKIRDIASQYSKASKYYFVCVVLIAQNLLLAFCEGCIGKKPKNQTKLSLPLLFLSRLMACLLTARCARGVCGPASDQLPSS